MHNKNGNKNIVRIYEIVKVNIVYVMCTYLKIFIIPDKYIHLSGD